MDFHIAIAYGIAASTVTALVTMGLHNRRSGWKRNTTDTILGILIAWAEARAAERKQDTARQPEPVRVTSGLVALSAAVGVAETPLHQSAEAPNAVETVESKVV